MSVSRRQQGAYLGRFRQGSYIPLCAQVLTSHLSPVWPDTAPTAYLYSDSALVSSFKIPVTDFASATGLFSKSVLVDQPLPLGRYRVVYRWTVGGVAGAVMDSFEIVGGGDPAGAVISMCSYDRPEARYILGQLSGGRLAQGRNPKL